MLRDLKLTNFRSYREKEFGFSGGTTVLVGPNAVGKTNVLEAIYSLATGRSFRAELEKEVIREGESFAWVEGKVGDEALEIIWDDRGRFTKTYKVNGVSKRQADFLGKMRAVLFSPIDLEIVVNGPAVRRKYLDLVLEQTHRDYRVAALVYERALRQRNRILRRAREEGRTASEIVEPLNYWDELLLSNGVIIYERRKEYLDFLNGLSKKIFPVSVKYDHSIISESRLAKYAVEELAAGATLVGPHRDDFVILKSHETEKGTHEVDVRLYGSRGEQRLAVFAIKLGELEYILHNTGEKPILLLDDIFSELDESNRHHILEVVPNQQTVMTTTDLQVLGEGYLKSTEVIKLK